MLEVCNKTLFLKRDHKCFLGLQVFLKPIADSWRVSHIHKTSLRGSCWARHAVIVSERIFCNVWTSEAKDSVVIVSESPRKHCNKILSKHYFQVILWNRTHEIIHTRQWIQSQKSKLFLILITFKWETWWKKKKNSTKQERTWISQAQSRIIWREW